MTKLPLFAFFPLENKGQQNGSAGQGAYLQSLSTCVPALGPTGDPRSARREVTPLVALALG